MVNNVIICLLKKIHHAPFHAKKGDTIDYHKKGRGRGEMEQRMGVTGLNYQSANQLNH